MLNLKLERVKKDLTQGKLAEKAGVVRQTISNIECGLTKPSVNLAKKLGEILEIEWTNFFDD